MCNDMCMATMTIDLAMSEQRLFEALVAEARRTGDEVLIRRWNARCVALSAKLERAARIRKLGVHPLVALGWA